MGNLSPIHSAFLPRNVTVSDGIALVAPAPSVHPTLQLKLTQPDSCQPVKYKHTHGHNYYSSPMHNYLVPSAGGDNVVSCVKRG